MGRTTDDLESDWRVHLRHRTPVEVDHHVVVPANDEQRRCRHIGQRLTREIRTAPARDHGPHPVGQSSRGHERGPAAGARAEQADREAAGVRLRIEPPNRSDESFGEETDVETELAGAEVDNLLVRRQ
jgi:hypothetical protein